MSMGVELIELALDEVRIAIYEAKYPQLMNYQSQLMRAESELMEMFADLEEGSVKKDRSGLARMVVDSWPLTHPVSEAVIAAVQEYEGRRRN